MAGPHEPYTQPCDSPLAVYQRILTLAPDATITAQDFNKFGKYGFNYPLDVLKMIADSEGKDDTLENLERPYTGITMMEFKNDAGESKAFFVLYDWSRCPSLFFGYDSAQWNMATSKYDQMMKLLDDAEKPKGRDA